MEISITLNIFVHGGTVCTLKFSASKRRIVRTAHLFQGRVLPFSFIVTV